MKFLECDFITYTSFEMLKVLVIVHLIPCPLIIWCGFSVAILFKIIGCHLSLLFADDPIVNFYFSMTELISRLIRINSSCMILKESVQTNYGENKNVFLVLKIIYFTNLKYSVLLIMKY